MASILKNWEFFQIYYKEEQLDKLYPFAIPFYNEDLTIFFENEPISRAVLSSQAEKIAVCSWRMQEKMKMRMRLSAPLGAELFETDFEVLSFSRNSSHHNMLSAANEWHPGFMDTLNLIFKKLGLGVPRETKQPVYQNHFMARADIYKQYVTEFIMPLMEITLDDDELYNLMIQDSRYGKLTQGDLASVKAKLGMDYYPMAPFVIERCPSLWFDLKGYKVTYV